MTDTFGLARRIVLTERGNGVEPISENRQYTASKDIEPVRSGSFAAARPEVSE